LTSHDDYIEDYLAKNPSCLKSILDGATAYKDADFMIVVAPTIYDNQKSFLDINVVEDIIDAV